MVSGRIRHRLRMMPVVVACAGLPFGCDRPSPPSGSPSPSTPAATADGAPRESAGPTNAVAARENPDLGNDILLTNLTQAGLRFEGLRGTADDPIVVRPRNPEDRILVMNPSGDWSIELIDCHHVRVESMQVFNANRGGILIRGSRESPCHDVQVTRSDVLPRSTTDDYDIGVRIEHGSEIGISDLNVLHAIEAGIDVRETEGLSIQDVILRGVGSEKYGVRLGVGVHDATLDTVACVSLSGNAFGVGVVPPEATSDVSIPSRTFATTDVTIVRCSTDGGEAPVVLGSASNVLVEYCTFMLPRKFVIGPAPVDGPWPPASGVRLDRNLVEWSPSDLEAILAPSIVGGVEPLGENLWWSSELPEMLPTLGGFPEASAPQRIDLDPRVFRKRLEPLEREAFRFGHRAPDAEIDPPTE